MLHREKLLGWVHVLVSVAGLGLGGFLCLGLGLSSDPGGQDALGFILWIFIVAQVFWLLPDLIGGLGLIWGASWARGTVGAVSLVLLFAFPVGTPLGVFGLWTLYGKAAREKLRAPRQPLGRAQGLALCAIAAAGALGLMIGLGYLFRDVLEAAPRPMASRPVIAAALGVVAIAVVIFTLVAGRGGFELNLSPESIRLRMEGKARQDKVVAEHNARLARLAADPVRARYVAMIKAGDYWSDEAIAYDLDPDRTAGCEHLAPIERAMRRAGVVLKPMFSPRHVEARCMIDAAGFAAMEKPASIAHYPDHYILERFGDQIPDPLVSCKLCNSALHMVAPDQAKPGTPVFPA